MSMAIDPRVNITHQIRAGQVYKDARTSDELRLVYLDDSHALLKDSDGVHARLEIRRDFEQYVGSGRYSVCGNVEVIADTVFRAIDFTKIDGVGKTTARALQAAGYATAEDIERANQDDLLAVRGVGEGNLENIMEYIKSMDGQVTL